jgi:hypothetical protein
MSVPSKIHNIRLVKIQPEERLAATSEELIEKLEENIEDIKKYGVKRIGLFGSYVRNEQKSEKPNLKQYILGSVKYAARL